MDFFHAEEQVAEWNIKAVELSGPWKEDAIWDSLVGEFWEWTAMGWSFSGDAKQAALGQPLGEKFITEGYTGRKKLMGESQWVAGGLTRRIATANARSSEWI